MANLKADLLNELRNQKYYTEMELIRLAQDPTMNYREKILDISDVLGSIALIDTKLGLVEGYFQETTPQIPQEEIPNLPQPVTTQVHQGQSHGE